MRPDARKIAWGLSAATVIAAACLLAAQPAIGRDGPVTPDTLSRALKEADGGGKIVLAPGEYGAVDFPKKTYKPALQVDARAARFTSISLDEVTGVSIDGGAIVGPGGHSYGILIRNAHDIRISNMNIGGAYRGVVVDRAEDVSLVGNTLAGLLSDGIDIGFSHRIHVERNSCSDFHPAPAIYDSDGKRLKDGDHADCIQAWSRPQYKPTSDLTIIDNEANGLMQGIFLGNHVRNGVDDGGFDRVVVRGNRVRVGVPNGITVSGARGGEVTKNVVRTTPGAVLPNRPERLVRAKLAVSGTDLQVCDNKVENIPNSPGTDACK